MSSRLLILSRAQLAGGALAPPGEAALRAALCGSDAPAPASGALSLHPQLRCTAWRADNRYFSAEVDLLSLPVQEPWQDACAAVLSEPGPVGASKHRCQALVALVDTGTNPNSLSALTALEHEPEVLLLCELSPTPALPASKDTAASPEAAEARTERLARLEGSQENDEGPLWEWSVEHGFEHVILPWHAAVGVPTALLGEPEGPKACTADAPPMQEEGQQGLARVVEALQNTMWGTLAMKPQPEHDSGPATATTREAPAGEKEACKPAGNSALIVNFVAVPPDTDGGDDDDDAGSVETSLAVEGGTISTASIAAALGLGSEYGSVPAVATWRVHNRYFTADVAMRFVDAAAQPSAALAAAREVLAEQSSSQAGRATGSAPFSSTTVSRCGAVILILSEEMGKNPAASALLAEWSDLIAQFPYADGCSGPEMLALCVNEDAAPYAPAIEWCADHGFELVRPPAILQQEHGCEDSSCGSSEFGDGQTLSRSTDKEGVWRLVEALKQNVWGTGRMHEQAAPAPRPQSDRSPSDAPAASSVKSGGSADATGEAPQLEDLLLSGTADDEDMSAAGGGSSQQAMASMEEMFREVSSFKAASSNMSREQRHAAAERIALNWGLLGKLDGDEYDSDDEAAELEKFLGDGGEKSGGEQ